MMLNMLVSVLCFASLPSMPAQSAVSLVQPNADAHALAKAELVKALREAASNARGTRWQFTIPVPRSSGPREPNPKPNPNPNPNPNPSPNPNPVASDRAPHQPLVEGTFEGTPEGWVLEGRLRTLDGSDDPSSNAIEQGSNDGQPEHSTRQQTWTAFEVATIGERGAWRFRTVQSAATPGADANTQPGTEQSLVTIETPPWVDPLSQFPLGVLDGSGRWLLAPWQHRPLTDVLDSDSSLRVKRLEGSARSWLITASEGEYASFELTLGLSATGDLERVRRVLNDANRVPRAVWEAQLRRNDATFTLDVRSTLECGTPAEVTGTVEWRGERRLSAVGGGSSGEAPPGGAPNASTIRERFDRLLAPPPGSVVRDNDCELVFRVGGREFTVAEVTFQAPEPIERHPGASLPDLIKRSRRLP